jgi:hypothetical protein
MNDEQLTYECGDPCSSEESVLGDGSFPTKLVV